MALWDEAHIGVDADSGLIDGVVGTAANDATVPAADSAALHGSETTSTILMYVARCSRCYALTQQPPSRVTCR
jgi:hypothetical protein